MEHREWLRSLARRDENNKFQQLHPVLQEFDILVMTNPRLRMLFQSMFDEVPKTESYTLDIIGYPALRNFHELLQALNYIIQTAPAFSERQRRMDAAGLPIMIALNRPSYTKSGMSAFIDPNVNLAMEKILNTWGEYLMSPNSTYVLGTSEDGWFSPTAVQDVEEAANIGQTNYTFNELFVSDEREPYHGFKSWDDYFVRRFREGIRPVASPDDPNVIINACESNPYNIQTNVKAYDDFWMKGRRYSIVDMLGVEGTQWVRGFVGGTVYQGYLSSLSYHRWHAPVSGRIVDSYIIKGTYFAQPDFLSLENQEMARQSNNDSIFDPLDFLPFESAMNTRAVIIIEADNPAIGTMAFIGVGLNEVSTCEITARKGRYVKKGDQIGMFHFGGSTHCLVFQNGVNVTGFPKTQEYNVPVRGKLAIVN